MTQALWSPSTRRVADANITRFMRLIRRERHPGVVDYQSLYRFSIESPKAFWRAVWEFGGVIGSAGSRSVEQFDRMPGASWFPDASFNFAENLLRYRNDQEALVFESETGIKSTLTYKQLY
ncbi:MAG: acetyl-coenzyme A synthetase N-terminal domain-containing protein, partial [Lysobacterales bacterium]